MNTLFHIGHSYHTVSLVEVAVVALGVVVAAVVAYAVVTRLAGRKKEKSI